MDLWFPQRFALVHPLSVFREERENLEPGRGCTHRAAIKRKEAPA